MWGNVGKLIVAKCFKKLPKSNLVTLAVQSNNFKFF